MAIANLMDSLPLTVSERAVICALVGEPLKTDSRIPMRFVERSTNARRPAHLEGPQELGRLLTLKPNLILQWPEKLVNVMEPEENE